MPTTRKKKEGKRFVCVGVHVSLFFRGVLVNDSFGVFTCSTPIEVRAENGAHVSNTQTTTTTRTKKTKQERGAHSEENNSKQAFLLPGQYTKKKTNEVIIIQRIGFKQGESTHHHPKESV